MIIESYRLMTLQTFANIIQKKKNNESLDFKHIYIIKFNFKGAFISDVHLNYVELIKIGQLSTPRKVRRRVTFCTKFIYYL